MTTQEDYIDCSVEECTHARLASGEVVEVSRKYDTPYIVVDGWMIRAATWPRLSITPVKLAPKPEPRKWEFERFTCGLDARYVCVTDDVPKGVMLRVTLEEII